MVRASNCATCASRSCNRPIHFITPPPESCSGGVILRAEVTPALRMQYRYSGRRLAVRRGRWAAQAFGRVAVRRGAVAAARTTLRVAKLCGYNLNINFINSVVVLPSISSSNSSSVKSESPTRAMNSVKKRRRTRASSDSRVSSLKSP